MESGQQSRSGEIKNGESNAETPNGLGLKTVALTHTSPGLQSDSGTRLANVVLDILQDITTEGSEWVVAVEAGNWTANRDGHNREGDEDEEVGGSHDEHADVGGGPVEGNAEEGIEHCEAGLVHC